MTRVNYPSKRCSVIVLVGCVLTLHGSLLAFSAIMHSPSVSEINHLPAGLSHLYQERFDLFRVNPPLVRTIAALPVILLSPATDWQSYDDSPLVRSEIAVGQDFLKANEARSLWYFTVARWVCIPFSILGGYICFRFARELYGLASGFMALILWCFCPYILGHASLITPDAPAAAMGIAAYYFFWRWLNTPKTGRAFWAGVVLGLAELTKFTLLVFYPLWILTWLIYKLPEYWLKNGKAWLGELGLMAGMYIVSLAVINLGYEFEGSFTPLGEFQFQSRLFSGIERPSPSSPLPKDEESLSIIGNHFSDTWLGKLPVPLPANFVQGIDTQRLDFERKMWSFLDGEWKLGGWWYYYVYALAIKLPLGTLGLFALSIPCMFWKTYRTTWRNELVLLLPIITILTLVSSQTGFSIHSRYVIPILPFAYIWCSKLVRSIEAKHWVVAIASSIFLCWSVGSSLFSYPHSLSYFNEVVGGPLGGHQHLLDSNIAWGQDIYYLKHWYDKTPEARPLYMASYGLFDPRLAGIEYFIPPVGLIDTTTKVSIPTEKLGPLPGWYAMDMNHLHGLRLPLKYYPEGISSFDAEKYDLTYFQHFKPIAVTGYSIYIYHLNLDEVNPVRRELGLAELPSSNPKEKGVGNGTNN